MKEYKLTVTFEGNGILPTETEVLTIAADSVEAARQAAPLHWKTKVRGRLVRIFDESGNELFANA